jgi:hypothetical protein
MTPETFARSVIESHLNGKSKGRIAKIERSYVERETERRAATAKQNE